MNSVMRKISSLDNPRPYGILLARENGDAKEKGDREHGFNGT